MQRFGTFLFGWWVGILSMSAVVLLALPAPQKREPHEEPAPAQTAPEQPAPEEETYLFF